MARLLYIPWFPLHLPACWFISACFLIKSIRAKKQAGGLVWASFRLTSLARIAGQVGKWTLFFGSVRFVMTGYPAQSSSISNGFSRFTKRIQRAWGYPHVWSPIIPWVESSCGQAAPPPMPSVAPWTKDSPCFRHGWSLWAIKRGYR